MKKNTSEVMNRTIPALRVFITSWGWDPWRVASRWMSFHQKKETPPMRRKEIRKRAFREVFRASRREETKAKAPKEVTIGQGLAVTRWKGLSFTVIYFTSLE